MYLPARGFFWAKIRNRNKLQHKIKVTIKRSIFGVVLWEVIKVTEFNRSERLELIHQGVSFKNAIIKAMENRDHKTPVILEISG